MPQHPTTEKSFANKSDQYLREDCDEAPLVEDLRVASLLGDIDGKRGLSAGCGSGAECSFLTSKGAIVDAIDTSSALLDTAKKRNPSLVFKNASVESIPYEDASFDFIYCGHVLHYFNDWNLALSEMSRILKSEGRLVVTIHHPLDHGYVDGPRIEIQTSWYDDFEVVVYPRSIKEMTDTFLSAGFELLEKIEITFEQDSPPLVVAFSLRKE